MSAIQHSKYADPYESGTAEYLDDNPRPSNIGGQRGYNDNAYGNNPYAEEKMGRDSQDPDGVNALGDIGGGERERPGRAGLHQPTSSFAAMGPPPRSTGILRMWRKDERGKQWTRGGGVRSTGRLFCCCISITILLIVSIILTIVMYVRPPSIMFNGFNYDLTSATINATTTDFSVPINLSVDVSNPNWFNANFEKITATLKYDGYNFGGGEVPGTNFRGYTKSKLVFPMRLNYSASTDTGGAIIKALATNCGANGATAKKITIDYQIGLWLRILSTTIKPNIGGSTSIDCPVDGSTIQSIIDHLH